MTRTSLAPILCAALLAFAGCAGVPTIDESANGPTVSPSSTATATPTTEPPAECPEPPANLSNDSAEAVAIEYEEARLHDELRNDDELEYFDVGYHYSPIAAVQNRSDGGVYVEVVVRYSYGTDEVEADGVPVRSLYFVDEREIRRVAELD